MTDLLTTDAGDLECATCGHEWTVATDDGSWVAQFEHTILITADGPEILTTP